MSNNKFIKFIVFLCLSALLSSCGMMPDFSKRPETIEPNARKRAQQNVIDGKGTSFFSSQKGDGSFLFASSNPMWKAALDTLDLWVIDVTIEGKAVAHGVLLW